MSRLMIATLVCVLTLTGFGQGQELKPLELGINFSINKAKLFEHKHGYPWQRGLEKLMELPKLSYIRLLLDSAAKESEVELALKVCQKKQVKVVLVPECNMSSLERWLTRYGHDERIALIQLGDQPYRGKGKQFIAEFPKLLEFAVTHTDKPLLFNFEANKVAALLADETTLFKGNELRATLSNYSNPRKNPAIERQFRYLCMDVVGDNLNWEALGKLTDKLDEIKWVPLLSLKAENPKSLQQGFKKSSDFRYAIIFLQDTELWLECLSRGDDAWLKAIEKILLTHVK